ncbi:MAG: metallophosphoesterase [Synergistaceae bacterium]|nr:metallophosphoesterase [Synergistaceae bacterium]
MGITVGILVGAIFEPLIALLVLFRVVLPCKKMSPFFRWFSIIILIILALRPLIFALIGEDISYPKLSPFFIEFTGTLFCSIVVFTFFVLARDIVVLFSKLWGKFSSRKSLSFSLGANFIIPTLAIAVILSFYGNYNAHLMPIVTEYTVESKHLPSSFDGLRIAYIADIHAWHGRRRAFVQSVVDITNEQKCQLVLLGGDYLDGSVEDMGDALLPLKDLHSKYGTFAVPGNHEYYFGYAEWKKFFEEKLNIPVLINQHKFIEGYNGQIIFITGISDKFAKKIGEEVPDVRRAMPVFGYHVFNILLSHRPGNAKENNKLGIDLQLSGHTHGGNVCYASDLIAYFNNGFVSGRYDLSNMTLIVSRGAGYWQGFAERLLEPAEIVVVTLRCKK